MKWNEQKLRLSASDLSNHLACRHITSLDLAVAAGLRSAPEWRSPDAWVLQQRGLAHESAYIDHLKAQNLSTADLRDIDSDRLALVKTHEAMKGGVDAIVQAVLTKDHWFGK